MLLPFFEWMEALPISNAIRGSVWFFAVDQSLHLVALAIFAGAVLVVDLRLLGRGLRQTPVVQVARDAQPWLMWGFVGLLVTGVPQLLSNAMKEYYSEYFWIKMYFLLVAVIYTLTIRRKVMLSEKAVKPVWAKTV